MKTIMFAANLALTVLIAGAASAAEPDGPPGWYVEGHEALGTQGPFDGLECANALEVAKIALDRKFPGHGSWPLRCVYYTKYHYIVMEVPEDVGLWAVGGPYLTLEECLQKIATSRDDPSLTRNYYCTRRNPNDP